jgi:hypothetical protein
MAVCAGATVLAPHLWRDDHVLTQSRDTQLRHVDWIDDK